MLIGFFLFNRHRQQATYFVWIMAEFRRWQNFAKHLFLAKNWLWGYKASIKSKVILFVPYDSYIMLWYHTISYWSHILYAVTKHLLKPHTISYCLDWTIYRLWNVKMPYAYVSDWWCGRADSGKRLQNALCLVMKLWVIKIMYVKSRVL